MAPHAKPKTSPLEVQEPVQAPFEGYRWMAGLQILQFVLGFFVSILLARHLSPTVYGVFSMAFIIVQFLQTTEGFCLEYVLVQEKEQDENLTETGFWASLLLSFMFTAALILIAPFISRFFNDAAVTVPLMVMSLTLPISALSFPHRIQVQRELRFKLSAWIEFISFTITATISLWMAFFLPSVWALVVFAIGRNVLRTFLLIWTIRWLPRFVWQWDLLRKQMPLAFKFTLNESITYWQQILPNVLIGKFFQAHSLGIFRLGLNLSQQSFQILYQIIARTIFPHLARLQHNPSALKRYYLGAFHAVLLCTLIPASFLITFSDTLILLFYGKQWQASGEIVQILALTGIFMSLQVLIRETLYAQGHVGKDLPINLLHLSLLLSVLLIWMPLPLHTISWMIVGGNMIAWLFAQWQLNLFLHISWKQIYVPFILHTCWIAVPSVIFRMLLPDVQSFFLLFWASIFWLMIVLGLLFVFQFKHFAHIKVLFVHDEERTQKRVVHISTVHAVEDPRILHKQLISLQNAGYEVHFIAQHTRSEELHGIPIVALPLKKGRLTRLWLQPKALWYALKLDADVYQIHDPELIPLLWCLKQFTNAKVVYDMHEDYLSQHKGFDGKLIRTLEKWSSKWINQLILASDSLLPIASKLFQPERTTVLANFAQLPALKPPKILPQKRPDNVILLYTGVMDNSRGLRLFLALASQIQVQKLPYKIRLAGKCFEENTWQYFIQHIENEGLTEIISIKGGLTYIPLSEMQIEYDAAHFGICFMENKFSYTETIPTKFYEYLSYGLPIICTNYRQWSDFVQTHEVGFATENDALSILELIEMFRTNEPLYSQYSTNALQIAPQFSWSVVAPKLIALYQNLCTSDRLLEV